MQIRDKVFLSYRRSDSGAIAQRLYDDLRSRYGAEKIYFDLVGARIGFDFNQRIINALNESAIVLAIIGPDWAASFRRGPDETDWMRFEVANALTMDGGSRVIPVLAEARMPPPGDLPAEISQISKMQAVELSRRANEWGPGMRVLYREIETRGIRRPPWPSPPRIVRIQHHRHPFLSTPGATAEALVHVLQVWGYTTLERDDVEGTVSFQWGANAKVSGKLIQWVYKRMREEGTRAVIERSPTGSVLDLALPSVRLITGAAGLTWAPVTYGATIVWERRVARRFFDGIQRRLDGRDAGPDPLAFFDGQR